MADTKISALTALTGANVDPAADVLPIVDTSVTTNKKILVGELLKTTFNALFDISGSSGGQVKFPSTQNASSDVNTLDDYEEGTWTADLTFATPGDLSVGYAVQQGIYTKIGRLVVVVYNIQTSSFTHTTSSGALSITGLPFTAATLQYASALIWGGITNATYTNITAQVGAGATTIGLIGSGSGVSPASIASADIPTGGTVLLRGTASYFV